MPKKPRQAHVPQQARKRKARRPAATTAQPSPLPVEEPVFADTPAVAAAAGALGDARGPVETRLHRRLDRLTETREQRTAARIVPGQLPAFERAYIVSELRQIGITSSVLLAVVIALALILR